MGKDDKEDSGFGFKDRAKAEETLKLLEQHDPNYRRLTVRGLLGRAKRVLSLTKAEEKIKNIKEAMEVFESWLAELDGNKQKDKPEKTKKETKEKRKSSDKAVQAAHERHSAEQLKWRKKFSVWFEQKKGFIDSLEESEPSHHEPDDAESSEDDEDQPSESVSGLGFKDPEAARGSLKALEGRDPDYQLLAVKGLLGRAKRVLTCTKDETKLSNIKEAMSILESFVDDFDTKHMSRENCPYLSLGIVKTAEGLAGDSVSEDQKSFIAAYASVRGKYKRLRNVGEDGNTWDIRRNVALKGLKEKNSEAELFTSNNEPTPEHLEYMLWAYSPEAAKVKKVVSETDVPDMDKLKIDRKRKSSGDGECDKKKKKEE